ncbi:MAG TPA: 5-formyltetrahydrofolate cyclo-ligase [Verrucomicrobia bacterium]|nr:MAG: 5-formyltetrahydrofolate cyclo-ligase [Lentisphaerae bacterium GWF2_57_35]HBA83443.1 5-formyltetrahydrofolate cyclo-ligase [Verrucomicrobiota bacterium]
MRGVLQTVDAREFRQAGRRMHKLLIGLPEYASARRIGCYLSLPREAATSRFIQACRADGKQVFVPAYREKTDGYQWSRLEEDAALAAGKWGIPEPRRPRWTAAQLDLIVVPGLAFDRAGRRVGRGKGYFDRLLAACRGFKVGLALERQLVRSAPVEAHDVRLDAVVTEAKIYPCRGTPGPGALKTMRRSRGVSGCAAGRR